MSEEPADFPVGGFTLRFKPILRGGLTGPRFLLQSSIRSKWQLDERCRCFERIGHRVRMLVLFLSNWLNATFVPGELRVDALLEKP